MTELSFSSSAPREGDAGPNAAAVMVAWRKELADERWVTRRQSRLPAAMCVIGRAEDRPHTGSGCECEWLDGRPSCPNLLLPNA